MFASEPLVGIERPPNEPTSSSTAILPSKDVSDPPSALSVYVNLIPLLNSVSSPPSPLSSNLNICATLSSVKYLLVCSEMESVPVELFATCKSPFESNTSI